MMIKTTLSAFAIAACFLGSACSGAVPTTPPANPMAPASQAATPSNTATAIFAGGCFWCMEKPFDQIPGVVSTTSGYTGGRVDNPTYELVGTGSTGHLEAVKIVYDPAKVTYAKLLDTYWRQVDPFDGEGQFCDKGPTYAPAIFVANDAEKTAAEASKAAVQARFPGQSVDVKILPARPFWNAEDYHQDYYLKNPIRYNYYRTGCGRDARLRAVWGQAETAH